MRRINLAARPQGRRRGARAGRRRGVRATVRGNDPMGRPGGDELAVLLVGANDDQAVARRAQDHLPASRASRSASTTRTSITVQMRAVLTEIAPGERSGEAALARCYGALRTAPIGDVRIVAAGRAHQRRHRRRHRHRPALGGHDRRRHVSRRPRAVARRDGRRVSRRGPRPRPPGRDQGPALRPRVRSRSRRSRSAPRPASSRRCTTRTSSRSTRSASTQGDVYFVMELVEGQPLSEVLRATLERREWFPTEAVAQIALEIGDALDAMHALGLIHRDVKPANILLDRERDRAVLVDVGVAVKAGDPRDAAGTPGFAAPESFLEQDGGTDDRRLRPRRDDVLRADRPPAVRLGPGAAGRAAPAQRSAARRRRSCGPASREAVDAVLAKALVAESEEALGVARRRSRSRSAARSSAAARSASSCRPSRRTSRSQAAEAVLAADRGHRELSAHRLDHDGRQRRSPAASAPRTCACCRASSSTTSASRAWRRSSPSIPTLAGASRADARAARVGRALAISSPRSSTPRSCCRTAPVPRKVGRGTMSATFARLFGADPSSLAAETVLAALPDVLAALSRLGRGRGRGQRRPARRHARRLLRLDRRLRAGRVPSSSASSS